MVKDLILVGRFGAPHGVGGDLRLQSFTGIPSAIAAYEPLLDESGTRQFSIVSLRPVKDAVFVAKIAGVVNRESAAVLTNAALYVPREVLPDAGEEEFYLTDLIGMAAFTQAGEAFGRVVNVLNFGGGDILELARTSSGETFFFCRSKRKFSRMLILKWAV